MEAATLLDDTVQLPFDDAGDTLSSHCITGSQTLRDTLPVSEAAVMIGQDGASMFGNLQQRTRDFWNQQDDDDTTNLVSNNSLQQQTSKTAQQSQTGNASECTKQQVDGTTTQQVDGTTTNIVNNNSSLSSPNPITRPTIRGNRLSPHNNKSLHLQFRL